MGGRLTLKDASPGPATGGAHPRPGPARKNLGKCLKVPGTGADDKDMSNHTETTNSKPVRLAWVLHLERDGQTVHRASHAGADIVRVRDDAGLWDDTFMVFRDGAKVGQAQSIGQARKVAERSA